MVKCIFVAILFMKICQQNGFEGFEANYVISIMAASRLHMTRNMTRIYGWRKLISQLPSSL